MGRGRKNGPAGAERSKPPVGERAANVAKGAEWVRFLEVSVRCGRLAAEAVGDLVVETCGGAAVSDPVDVEIARREGRWDLDDLEPGDPAWVVVTGYLPDTADRPNRQQVLAAGLERIRERSGAVAEVTERWVAEEDWATAWKAHFQPLAIGRRLLVVPVWRADETPVAGRLPVVLDPGMAFGTGQHETTALCLEWLEDLIASNKATRDVGQGPVLDVGQGPVLDVGTGSGILAIAAARLGAGPVLGFDVDPVAVQAARANVARNGLADRVQIVQGELTDPTLRQWCAAHPPMVVVANLVAGLIVTLAPLLTAVLAPGGRLVVSGIIAERQVEVERALVATGLNGVEARAAGGWVALSARRS